MRHRAEIARFFRYLVAGTAAFAVDASVLWLAVRVTGLDPYSGRLFGFSAGIVTAWLVNRSYAFRNSGHGRSLGSEFFRYVVVNSGGAVVNVSLYALLVAAGGFFANHIVIAAGLGACAGLVFNYVGNRNHVFRRQKAGDQGTGGPGE